MIWLEDAAIWRGYLAAADKKRKIAGRNRAALMELPKNESGEWSEEEK